MAFDLNKWSKDKYKKITIMLDRKKDAKLIEEIEKSGKSATEFFREKMARN